MGSWEVAWGSQGGQGASNLVRGSPKGAPKGCKSEPKVTKSSSEIGKVMVWEQQREKSTSKCFFFWFFHRFLVRNMYNALKPDAAREAQQNVGYLIGDDDR